MKGVMLANWIFLIIFLFLYIISITQVQNVMGIFETIFSDFNGQDLWSDIPAETWSLLNILLYIIVPLGAIVWTILASKPSEQIGYRY